MVNASKSITACMPLLRFWLRYGCLDTEQVELEAIEGVEMVFELFAVARFQLIYFDILGRIGDVWGVYGY